MAENPFYFWGNAKPGEAGSYESLLARRKIAESLMGKRSPYPKNIGEGIASLGENIGDVLMLRDLDRREKAQAAYEEGAFKGALGGGSAPPGTAPPVLGPRVGTGGGGGYVPPIPGGGERAPVAEGDFLPLPRAEIPSGVPEKVALEGGGTADVFGAGLVSPIDAEAVGRESPRFKTKDNPDVRNYIGFRRAVEGINPELQDRLLAFYQTLTPAERESFIITEGARTREQQQMYYDRAQGRWMVGRPGTSRHELINQPRTGGAVDIAEGPARDRLLREGHLFGLENLRGDAPHYQLAANRRPLPARDPRSGVTAIDPPAPTPVVAEAPPSVFGAAPPLPPAFSGPGGGPPPPITGGGSIAGLGGGNPEEDTLAALPYENPINPTTIRPAPPAAAAALGAGAMPPTGPESPAGEVAALPPAGPPGPGGRTLGPALPPRFGQVFDAYNRPPEPPPESLPPWMAGFGPGARTAPPPVGAQTAAPAPDVAPASTVAAMTPPVAEPPAPPAPPAPAPAAAAPPVLGGLLNPQSIALAPPGVRGPMGPAPAELTKAPPPAAVAQGLLPSQEPLPPPGIPEIPPEVVRTPRPAPLPMTPLAQRMLEFSRLRGVSDFRRQQALDYVQREETTRKEAEARRENDYVHQRAQEDKLEEERRTVLRNLPEKTVADLKARIDIQAAQGKLQPELLKLWGEVQKAQAEAASAETIEAEGKKYERIKNAPPGTPWREIVGISPSEKLTESQAKAVLHLRDALTAHRQFDDIPGADVALTGLRENFYKQVPVAGNYLIPSQYRGAKNAADAWMLTHIRNVSGAVIGRDEIPQHYPLYFPIPGDDAAEIERKRERREEKNRGLYDTLGDAKEPGKRMYQEFFDREAERPVAKPANERDINRLQPGRWFVAPDGTERQKPMRIRVPVSMEPRK